jgi:hypothetical protein
MAVRNLLEVLHTEETKDLPDLEISVFMTYLKHYIPGITSKRFGYPHFSNFMRFVVTAGPLTIYAAENSHKISRRGEVGEKGEMLPDIAGLVFTASDGTRYNSLFDIPEGATFASAIEKPAPKTAEKKTSESKRSEPKPRAELQPKRRGRPPRALEKPAEEQTPAEPIVMDEGSVRKWIKTQFEELASGDKLSAAEARRMTNADYSAKTFGIRTPILREITTHSNLNEQRTVNGKTKYWKESFKFNGKFYLVYKEWVVNLHAERFNSWLSKVKK